VLNLSSWVIIMGLFIVRSLYVRRFNGPRTDSQKDLGERVENVVRLQARRVPKWFAPVRRRGGKAILRQSLRRSNRFSSGSLQDFQIGTARVQTLKSLLMVDDTWQTPSDHDGVRAIQVEFEKNGTTMDKVCLKYVLEERAGSCNRLFQGHAHAMDCDANGMLREERKNHSGEGMRLDDFVNLRQSKDAGLKRAHVLALRLYTTEAFKTLNAPLQNAQAKAHPMPCTIHFLNEGIKLLRQNLADSPGNDQTTLWRGLKNINPDSIFKDLGDGGMHLAPMSTSSDLEQALEYSASRSALLLSLNIDPATPAERGASISYLSVYGDECEVVYPPLTYLRLMVEEDRFVHEWRDENNYDVLYSVAVIKVRPSATT